VVSKVAMAVSGAEPETNRIEGSLNSTTTTVASICLSRSLSMISHARLRFYQAQFEKESCHGLSGLSRRQYLHAMRSSAILSTSQSVEISF
jgi:hypothetical protein